MPVTLPNGVIVMNVTPHDLIFQDIHWEEEVVVPSEMVVSADTRDRLVKLHGKASLIELIFLPREEIAEWIRETKKMYPGILLVGSVLAARAYPEDVVAPVPRFRGERGGKRDPRPLMNPNRFTIFPKGEANHGRLHTR